MEINIKKVKERLTRSGYFFGALLLHIILLLILASWVVFSIPAHQDIAVFQQIHLPPPVKVPPPPPPTLASGGGAAMPRMLVTAPIPHILTIRTIAPSSFDVALPSSAVPNLKDFLDKGPGSGRGAGIGAGTNLYGSIDGQGLVGYLYDLKQTPNGKPTDIAETDVERANPGSVAPGWQSSPPTLKGEKALKDFITSWNTGDLDESYYKSPAPLVATQICIPDRPSVEAPKEFNVEGKVAPLRWIAVYSAKVSPPDTGTYRFIGLGDDFLVVRMDGQLVLDASYPGYGEELMPSIRSKEDVGTAWSGIPMIAGPWFEVEAGIAAQMNVLIGEGPGGTSGFILMIQKKGDDSPKGDYPVFQLVDSPVPDFPDMAAFTKKKMVWQLGH